MKKIISLIAVMLLAITGAGTAWAQDVTFTLDIDNPAALEVSVNYETQTLVAGENTFTVAPYTSVAVKVVPPYAFESITNAQGISELGNAYNGTWYYYPSEYNAGTIKITTYNLDDRRTASFTVNVDNPGKVNMVLQGTYSPVTLVSGANVVKFIPGVETAVTISSTDYQIPLYSVKLNGTNLSASNNSYYVTLEDGCVIDIEADFPDIDVILTFDYSEGGEGAIASVNVDGAPAPGFDGKSLQVKAGTPIALVPDPGYQIEALKVNGQQIYWTGGYPYNMVVTENTLFEITAHKLGSINATVIVDDPANITLFRGYSYNNDVIALSQGENAIELLENNSVVSWQANANCQIVSVTVNGAELPSYNTSYTLNDGDVLTFTTYRITLDKQCVVWIDNRAAADYYFSLTASDRSMIDIADGYNIVDFYDGMNPFMIGWASSGSNLVNKVFVNDTQISPMYEGSTNFETVIANGDVVKIFLTTEPVECEVTVNNTSEADVEITRDIIVPVTGSFTAFGGTVVSVASATPIAVSANGVTVEPADGKYTLTIDGNTTIDITKYTSIRSVATEADANAPVYNMQGMRVGTAAGINHLPAGLYIVSGRKVLVK